MESKNRKEIDNSLFLFIILYTRLTFQDTEVYRGNGNLLRALTRYE